jgi:phosphate transport system permease protein
MSPTSLPKKTVQISEPSVWGTSAAVSGTLLMMALLLYVILVNGLGTFWPAPLELFRLEDGGALLGEIHGREADDQGAVTALRLKIGNRDLYGQDFRWVATAGIRSRERPPDAVMLEREEFGNFFGFLRALHLDGLGADLPEDPWERLLAAQHIVAQRRKALADSQDDLGALSNRIERLRDRIERLRYEHPSAHAETIRHLQARQDLLVERFERSNEEIAQRLVRLRAHTATFAAADGQSKEIALANLVRVVRPNAMGVPAKVGFYASRLGELLWGTPREANTEGGLFPAIFGTVMMVMLMSVFCLPLGVIAAIYLREYAREGLLVRLVRIAVYNLAGVPSIVFGIFGLGFFVYGVGGSIDQVFFPHRLPTPTFGTGGILWASLTLSLLTVPVVIVATEEGLTAIPRGLREASLALGATRFQTLLRVIMPMAVPGIITGFILAMARAAGEVAPLMITGVVKLAPTLPIDGTCPFLHLERKFMHLGFHIYDVGFQSPNVEAAKPMVYITTLLLIAIVILLSLLSIFLRNSLRKRFQTATF